MTNNNELTEIDLQLENLESLTDVLEEKHKRLTEQENDISKEVSDQEKLLKYYEMKLEEYTEEE